MSRDNWERLVAAVLKRQQLWVLFHEQSRSPSISTTSSDHLSERFLDFPSENLSPVPASPHSQVSKNAIGLCTGKLFAAWFGRTEAKDKYFVNIGKEDQRLSVTEQQFVATAEDFSDENVLGCGHYTIYEDWQADGSLMTVKRLKTGAKLMFLADLEINNIVRLPVVLRNLCFCITSNQRLIVYPIMANGIVASCLEGRNSEVGWPIRKCIALWAARGLAYLHCKCDEKIIDHDFTARNILLDEDFETVAVDFELTIDVTCANTEKSDVFGYGIFLLELITAQRAWKLLADDERVPLLDWVEKVSREGKWEMMIAADCRGNYIEEVVKQLLQIAIFCTQRSPENRPKMSEVVTMLQVEGDSEDTYEIE